MAYFLTAINNRAELGREKGENLGKHGIL
jgi:hypothetical protein